MKKTKKPTMEEVPQQIVLPDDKKEPHISLTTCDDVVKQATIVIERLELNITKAVQQVDDFKERLISIKAQKELAEQIKQKLLASGVV